MQPRRGYGLFQCRPIGFLAALHLGEFVDDLPVAAVEIGGDRGSLSIKAQPGFALAAGADPVVATNFPLFVAMAASVTIGANTLHSHMMPTNNQMKSSDFIGKMQRSDFIAKTG
jgi:hypothetical protein